jgi:predicted nucleotidyltransferase
MVIWLPEGQTLPTLADAAAMAERIKAQWPEAEIWLFGSVARDRVGRGSDIDLAVVLPDAALAARRRSEVVAELRRAAGPREHDLDLVLFEASRFARMRGEPNGLEAVVQREGMRLA